MSFQCLAEGVSRQCTRLESVDHEFMPQFGQTKDYEIDVCCFSAKHTALRNKSKDCLAENQNNVSEWSVYMQTVV